MGCLLLTGSTERLLQVLVKGQLLVLWRGRLVLLELMGPGD